MPSKISDPALELVHAKGLVRARALALVGVSGEKLQQLLRSGALVRISRGLYGSPDRALTEQDELAQLAIKYPNIVFCLLTALQIHGLTTQNSHEVWVAISSKARAPRVSYPPLHIVRFSDLGLAVEQKSIDGVVYIPVTSVAKTIVDCFKYRSRVGLDVAIEALRDGIRRRKATRADIMRYARICRVQNVMRPYLETLG